MLFSLSDISSRLFACTDDGGWIDTVDSHRVFIKDLALPIHRQFRTYFPEPIHDRVIGARHQAVGRPIARHHAAVDAKYGNCVKYDVPIQRGGPFGAQHAYAGDLDI